MSKPGFLLPSELTRVQGNIYLANACAHVFLAMRDDAAEQDHVNITIAEPGGGYRTMAFTLAMRADPAKYNVTPGVTPSLYSIHMEGDAMDIVGGLAWVKKNGHKYGISFPLKNDKNHGVWDGKTMPAGAGTRINEETTMPQIQFYERTEGTQEWMRGGRELPGGYEVTLDGTLARQWGRQYSGEGTIPVHLTRDLYVAQQAFLKADHDKWKAEQIALLREAIGTPSGTVPPDLVTKTDLDATSRTILDAIPTAEANGAAARAAIVVEKS